ncbi:phosphoglycerate mutase [Ottowia sp.]|uniref:phosphoglycerate mutase n=1 Tax=Ottowia sp. TaxID=1898956 RepID=UPI003A848118
MSAAAQPFHLFIPHAVPALPEGTAPPDWPVPPELEALLARMQRTDTLEVAEDSPATPFEHALARALHLQGQPGQWPWAAADTHTVGTPCAWLRPCHWQLGLDHVTLLDPAALALTESESRALLAAVQPLLAEDGIALTYHHPDAWLARGELFRNLSTCSMARALQRPVTREALAQAPTNAQSAHVRRLQTELQMLLYPHPVNEAREQQRGWPVNALWIDGAGVLTAALPPSPHVLVDHHLADLPLNADPAQRLSAWQTIARSALARLRQALDAGQRVQLTLCGPRRAITLQSGLGLTAKITSLFRPQRWSELHKQL